MGQFVAYYRVSTDKQGRSGLGLDAQRHAVKSYLDQVGGHLVEEYTETESGKRNARPQLAAALKRCRKEKATLILATLDRLARKVAFVASLMESKTPFVLADMPQAGPFEIHIRAAMAEEEGRKISERTRRALAVAKMRGTKLGNPQLDQLNSKSMKAADVFALSMASTIAELRGQGYSTYEALKDELNRRGVPTARGGKWHEPTVQRLENRLRRLSA